MFKTGLALGFAAGYVLGTKAGRERYEQIAESVRAFSQNPGVQRLTDEVSRTVNIGKERASTAATQAVDQASSTLADKATKAREKVASKTTKQDSATEKVATPPTTGTATTPAT